MHIFQLIRNAGKVAFAAAGFAGVVLVMTSSASASGPQCAPRHIAQNIKTAVLAMKATQYCLREDLPYTAAEVSERIDSLRCGEESSRIIDELLGDFEQAYKTILARDTRHVVCMQAAMISFEDLNAAKK